MRPHEVAVHSPQKCGMPEPLRDLQGVLQNPLSGIAATRAVVAQSQGELDSYHERLVFCGLRPLERLLEFPDRLSQRSTRHVPDSNLSIRLGHLALVPIRLRGSEDAAPQRHAGRDLPESTSRPGQASDDLRQGLQYNLLPIPLCKGCNERMTKASIMNRPGYKCLKCAVMI